MCGALCKGYVQYSTTLGILRNVVIEPVPRVARTTSSQEVEELFEETTTPPGAPPAAEDDTFNY